MTFYNTLIGVHPSCINLRCGNTGCSAAYQYTAQVLPLRYSAFVSDCGRSLPGQLSPCPAARPLVSHFQPLTLRSKTKLKFVVSHNPFHFAYPDQCEGHAGTQQVSCPAPNVCRHLAGYLTGVGGMVVPCKYPNQDQGCAGTLQI